MLSETSSTWRHAVAPIAEQVSRTLWSTIRNNGRSQLPATHLTQSRRRYAKGNPKVRVILPQHPPHICVTCGAKVSAGHRYCNRCKVAVTSKALVKAAQIGRLASHTTAAETKRADKRRRDFAAQKAWPASDQPAWLNEKTYLRKIHPRLAVVTISAIRQALSVSKGYATNIRSGKRLPHPRHWQILANLAGVIA